MWRGTKLAASAADISWAWLVMTSSEKGRGSSPNDPVGKIARWN